MKNKIIIGVDPDIELSGFSLLNVETKAINLERMGFPELLERLDQNKTLFGKSLLVVVEAGWLNRGNWHLSRAVNFASAARTGEKVGANHQVGKLIIEYCKYHEIDVIGHKPLPTIWSSANGKITRKEFAYITGYDKQSNTEERDAGMLAWYVAKLPIRIKSRLK